jgi:nucleotide-binding universal stress UspA family protein
MTHVFCPTDFSVASHAAFQHALSLTLALRGRLTLMHVAGGADGEAGGFPGVRAQLERWGRLPDGSTETAVAGLGIAAEKVLGREGDPVDGVLHYLERHPADLIVLATHQREGRARWLGRAVAEPIARGAQAMTLFLPHGGAGFVDARAGIPLLRRILIPICAQPAPQPAVRASVNLLQACGILDASLTLFHAGDMPDMPALEVPAPGTALTFAHLARPGDPVEQILTAARETAADLVVMSTAGHHGFLDALRGSTTERVLRQLSCPLLAVPVLRSA